MKKYLFILITLFSIYHVPTHAADLVRTSKRELQGRLDHTDKALNYIRNEWITAQVAAAHGQKDQSFIAQTYKAQMDQLIADKKRLEQQLRQLD